MWAETPFKHLSKFYVSIELKAKNPENYQTSWISVLGTSRETNAFKLLSFEMVDKTQKNFSAFVLTKDVQFELFLVIEG